MRKEKVTMPRHEQEDQQRPEFALSPKNSRRWLENNHQEGIFLPVALDVMVEDVVRNAEELFAQEEHALSGVTNIVAIVKEHPDLLNTAATRIGQNALALRTGLHDPQMVYMSGLCFYEAFAQAERESGASMSPGKMLITQTRRKMAEVLTRFAKEKKISFMADKLAMDSQALDVYSPPLQVDTITPDETDQEIVRLVAEGLSNKEVALQIGLSPSTVKNRITRVLGLLGVKNRTEIAIKILELNR